MHTTLLIARMLHDFESKRESVCYFNDTGNTIDTNTLQSLPTSDTLVLRKDQFYVTDSNSAHSFCYTSLEINGTLIQRTEMDNPAHFSNSCNCNPVQTCDKTEELRIAASNNDCNILSDIKIRLKVTADSSNQPINNDYFSRHKNTRQDSTNIAKFKFTPSTIIEQDPKESTVDFECTDSEYAETVECLKQHVQERTVLPDPKIDINVIQVYYLQFEPVLDIVMQIAEGHTPSPIVTMRYEILRFCTFRTYPKVNKPFILRLAQAGFYYASDGDCVICYACGIRRCNWSEDEIPRNIHKGINPSCNFLTKNDEVNVPVIYYGADKKGLTFLESIPDVDPNRNILAGDENQESLASAQIQQSHYESLGVNSALPKHPQYATILDREKSFKNWPTTSSQTPKDLADAGLFYAGFGDCVRCFYCGIGLRHWTEDDDPWIEHARWAKTCIYVRQKKGLEFVNLVQLAVQYSQDSTKQSNTSVANQLPDTEVERILLSDAAQCVLEMGYQPRIIKQAIQVLFRLNGETNISSKSLMEKVLEIEEESNKNSVQATTKQQSTMKTASKSSNNGSCQTNKQSTNHVECLARNDRDAEPEVAQAVKAENKLLKEQTLCKVCLDKTVCIVFLPCGHLVTCADCAPAMRKCPICRAVVRGTVRTYMT